MDFGRGVLALATMELGRHIGDDGLALDGRQTLAIVVFVLAGSAHGDDVERDPEAPCEPDRCRCRVARGGVVAGGEQQPQAAVAVGQLLAVAGGKDARLAVTANFWIERPVERFGRFRLDREEGAFADFMHIVAFAQQPIGFVLHAVEVQSPAEAFAPSGLLGEHLGAGDVDEVHAQRNDQYRFLARVFEVDLLQRALDVVDGAEIGRAVDAHDAQLRALRLAARLDEVVTAGIIDRHQRLDAGFRGAVQVEQQGNQYACRDAGFEVHQGTDHGDPEDERLLPAGLPDRPDVVEIDQAPGDQEEDAGHCRIRQIGRKWRHQQQDHEQEHGGENGRQRGARAGFVIHPRAIEGTRRGIAREEGADDVGKPLADEFLVAVDALL